MEPFRPWSSRGSAAPRRAVRGAGGAAAHAGAAVHPWATAALLCMLLVGVALVSRYSVPTPLTEESHMVSARLPSVSGTASSSPTAAETPTPAVTPTATTSLTATATPSSAATSTSSAESTATPTASATRSATRTATRTRTASRTAAVTATRSATRSALRSTIVRSASWTQLPIPSVCDDSGPDVSDGRDGGGDGGARVALAVQGRASEISEWKRLLSRMRGFADVTFFFLAYDGNSGGDAALAGADCGGDGGACWAPAEERTTWTEGRNLLAARVLAAEAARGSRFRYWLFADSDARLERCECMPSAAAPAEPGEADDSVAAAQWRCCFEPLLDVLRSAFEPATLSWGYASGGAPAKTVAGALRAQDLALDGSLTAVPLRQLNCADARLQAFHRDAAPLLLPYFADLDATSWWSSQGILHHLTAGCLAGANYELFVVRNSSALENPEHAQYPRVGRVQSIIAAETRILNASLGAALWPWPVSLSTNARGPVGCQSARLPYEAVAITSAATGGADSWRKTPAFEACAAATRARFCHLRDLFAAA